MAKTTADLLVERLSQWGVDTIFGFPGGGGNGNFEAVRTPQDAIRFVQGGHEGAAAFAACGTRSTPAASGCVWRLLVLAGFIS